MEKGAGLSPDQHYSYGASCGSGHVAPWAFSKTSWSKSQLFLPCIQLEFILAMLHCMFILQQNKMSYTMQVSECFQMCPGMTQRTLKDPCATSCVGCDWPTANQSQSANHFISTLTGWNTLNADYKDTMTWTKYAEIFGTAFMVWINWMWKI